MSESPEERQARLMEALVAAKERELAAINRLVAVTQEHDQQMRRVGRWLPSWLSRWLNFDVYSE